MLPISRLESCLRVNCRSTTAPTERGSMETSRGIIPKIILLVFLIAILTAAYAGYQATVRNVADSLYDRILTSPPANPASYPTEAARLDRAERIQNMWRLLDQPTIDLVEDQADLPLPLRITRTTVIPNPEDLRSRAVTVFTRDLAALSGRTASSVTRAGWVAEIGVWRAAQAHTTK